MTNVTNISGEAVTPQLVPNTLHMTEKARDTIGLWLKDEDTNTDQLVRNLMTLLNMGARGYRESESLIVFETPRMTIGLFRDRKGEVTLHS